MLADIFSKINIKKTKKACLAQGLRHGYWRYCHKILILGQGGRLLMDNEYKTFISNITLTTAQSEDAQTKYTGVCKKLYDKYYSGNYDEGCKFLFGSYKTKTNVRPLTEDQDVDVLFKIPKETFEKFDAYGSNGQSALLQEVRTALQEKYTTTDKIKAWGKVVLVQFAENHHNVEVLPAYEQEDKTFLIPNSEDGGSWETFDPRAEVKKFEDSNEKTQGLTRDLCKMLKSWAHNTTSMTYKSYKRMDDVISFLDKYYPTGKGDISYAKIVFDFFDYMSSSCGSDIKTHVDTALERARKACEYEDNDKLIEATDEWRKIFGDVFPKVYVNPQKNIRNEIGPNPVRPWYN